MTSADIPEKVPLSIQGWEERQLEDLFSLEYGAGLPEAFRTDGDFPVYGSNGQVGTHATFLTQGPGIIVGRKGSVGAIIWSESPFWPIDTTYFVNPHKAMNLRWCYWRLLSLPLARLDSSTGVPGLNRNDVYKIKINVPPPSDQSYIATILDTIDTEIQRTEQFVAKLKQVKSGLSHELLTRGIDEHGEMRDPVAQPREFKDSPLGKIPKRWDITTLGTAVLKGGGVLQTGPFGSQLHAHEYVVEGIPVIMPQDIQDDYIINDHIASIPLAKAEKLARHRVEANDVIFARRGDLSRCAYISTQEIGWICGTGCLLVKPPRRILYGPWLAQTYRHYSSQRQILARAVGSTMVNLNTTLLSNLVIAQPDYNEQLAIVTRLDGINSRITTEEAHLTKLKQIKKGLMDDLLTGRVRVTKLSMEHEKECG